MKQSDGSSAAMRRVTLLLDGMSRAAILPFGPRLVHRLLFGEEGGSSELFGWSRTTYPLAITLAAYSMGRTIGTMFAEKLPLSHSKLIHMVARLGGAAFALHVFSFGAGLASVRWLVAIRFVSGALAGFLCRITKAKLSGDESYDSDEETGDNATNSRARRKNGCFIEVTAGTAKIYMTGFAISILLGGLFYRHIKDSKKFQALSGAEPLTLSPMFFVFVAFMGELFLRALFWYTEEAGRSVLSAPSYDSVRTRQNSVDSEFFDPLSVSKHMASPLRHRRNSGARDLETPSRVRINSALSETSYSEFFDCEVFEGNDETDVQAVQSDEMNTSLSIDLEEFSNRNPYEVAVYKDFKTVYPDGSPAFVTAGHSEKSIPQRYIDFCSGNEKRARNMWETTQRWRRETNAWRIHTGPHPHFGSIKKAYPHFIHGHTKQGYPIIYEQPGRMDLKNLFRSGCDVSDMVNHYIFFVEFIWNHLCSRKELMQLRGEDDTMAPNQGTMVVMDVQGISFSMLSGDVVKYLSRAGEVNNNHYPLGLKRAALVNSPFWLAGAWSGIKGIIPDSVQVDILSPTRSLQGLREYVDDDQIPPEYGGSSPYALGEHPYELELERLVERAETLEGFDGIVEPKGSNEPTVSFDHNDQRLVSDQDGSEALTSQVTFRSEISRSPMPKPLRRRTGSCDRQRSTGSQMSPIEEDRAKLGRRPFVEPKDVADDILTIVSAMHTCWYAVQGSIEMLVPLWILSPPILGGLGYQPSRAGVALFCAFVVVLWVVRTKFARFVASMPSKAPMRAFRIGVGSEVALFLLLPLIPSSVTSVARADSVLNMASTVILLATLVIANLLGRSASTILHRIACEGYSRNSTRRYWLAVIYGKDRLMSHCASGRFTSMLQSVGEIIGIFAVAPIYSWSTLHERPVPFDATFCFFIASFVSFAIYVCSFSLHLNVVGEFESHPRDQFEDDAKRCCSVLGEMIAVPVNDIASLLEEANWSASPFIGYGKDHLSSQSYHSVEGKKSKV